VRDNPFQLLGVVFGSIFVLVGLAGFAVTGFGSLVGNVGVLGVFSVNPLHNVAHLVIGLLWLGSAANADSARAAAQVFGVVYLLLSILGFFAVGAALNTLALNTADNLLHVVSGGSALLLSILVPRFARRNVGKPEAAAAGRGR